MKKLIHLDAECAKDEKERNIFDRMLNGMFLITVGVVMGYAWCWFAFN